MASGITFSRSGSLQPWIGAGGFCSLALDSHQRPHISYLSYGGGLTYARWDGASWQKQKIPIPARTIEFYTSIALDQNDHPIISFYEVDNAEGERAGSSSERHVEWKVLGTDDGG